MNDHLLLRGHDPPRGVGVGTYLLFGGPPPSRVDFQTGGREGRVGGPVSQGGVGVGEPEE